MTLNEALALGLTPRPWKVSVLPPVDAKTPVCKALVSLDGVSGKLVEGDTVDQDWLIVIAYERNEDSQ